MTATNAQGRKGEQKERRGKMVCLTNDSDQFFALTNKNSGIA
jgi:hypothetical protein